MNKNTWLIVALPNPEMKEEIDKIAKKAGYATRSEFIRTVLREIVENNKSPGS